MKIRAEEQYVDRWLAVDDSTYDGPGSIIGRGDTRQEAIDDLKQQLLDKRGWIDLTDDDLMKYTNQALDDFWQSIKDNLLSATSGDLSPEATNRLQEAAFNAVKEWYNNNCVKDLT